ncbi:MAG: HAD-IA family hydrolase [bacterium]|nr:HAD-IA family hydrolase [bacterium]
MAVRPNGAAARTAEELIATLSGQQHAKIDALGFRDLVDAVCVSGDLGVEKPSPEIFELAAEQASASLTGARMVGDSPANDVNGGLSHSPLKCERPAALGT